MSIKFKYFLSFFLAGLSVIIIFFLKIYSFYPFFVEHFYSCKFYVSFSAFVRSFFGKWTINVGDLLFIVLLFLFFVITFRVGYLIWNRKYRYILNLRIGLLVFIIVAYNYILFNVFWGLNYKRIPLEEQLKLPALTHNKEDIVYLMDFFSKKLNAMADSVSAHRSYCVNFPQARTMVIAQVQSVIADTMRFHTIDSPLALSYENPSIKRSILGFILNKAGIAGYHHPFTGEAIINTNVPNILLPAVIVHEIIHQMGYAKEEETMLVSYIMAHYMKEMLVTYSIYLDCLLALLNQVKNTDMEFYMRTLTRLHPDVKQDVMNFYTYLTQNKYQFSSLKTKMYTIFFALNSTVQGIEAKSMAQSLIVAYTKMKADSETKLLLPSLVRKNFRPIKKRVNFVHP